MQIVAPTYSPDQAPQMPYVRFERRAEEDRKASEAAGHCVMKDVTWVIVQASGSKDTSEKKASDWLISMQDLAKNERVPRDWPGRYAEAIERWEKGQELPVDGTPIKTWTALSPAQVKNLIDANVLTIEALAAANVETVTRLGMGGLVLKQTAERWLAESKGPGKLIKENENMRVELGEAKERIAALEQSIRELQANSSKAKGPTVITA